jgi:hypothetical protein
LAPWFILALAVVLVRANRHPRILLLLVPLLTENLLWMGFRELLSLPSSSRSMWDQMFAFFAAGFTLLWLLAFQLANRNRSITFLLALVTMLAVSLLGAVSCNMSFSDETMQIVVFLAMMATALLAGFALAGWRCREHYGPVRFMLWQALWTVTAALVAMLAFAVIVSLAAGFMPPLLQVLIVGLVGGLLLCAIDLPFMVLAFCSPFFRERFFACLHLRLMPDASGGPSPQDASPGISEKRESD